MQTIQFDLPEETKLQIQNISKELAEIKSNFQPKEPNEYLTRQDVAEMLKIDLSTIWNWQNKKILLPKQIGGRVLFLRSDIENAIVELKK